MEPQILPSTMGLSSPPDPGFGLDPWKVIGSSDIIPGQPDPLRILFFLKSFTWCCITSLFLKEIKQMKKVQLWKEILPFPRTISQWGSEMGKKHRSKSFGEGNLLTLSDTTERLANLPCSLPFVYSLSPDAPVACYVWVHLSPGYRMNGEWRWWFLELQVTNSWLCPMCSMLTLSSFPH